MILYSLPDWLMAICVVGGIVSIALIGYFVFHWTCQPKFTDDNKSVALTVLTVVATINSLLLAFLAVSVWQSFNAADDAVVQEANTVGALARDLAIYGTAEARDARQQLREYANVVVTTEWQDMKRGEASPRAWDQFDRMFAVIGTLEPDTPRRTVMLPEIWARANELLKQRRTRLHTSESKVPMTLWMVVLLGSILTIGTTYALTPSRFHVSMLGVTAASTALVFHLIVAMDRPFAGEQSIDAGPFRLAIDNMNRWDTQIAPNPETTTGKR